MTQFDRITLGRQARELGFVRDTFEKVCRLADVLAFLESDALLSKTLALKGGTAINLTIFDLPRLSVDIDLDYSENVPREEMLAQREIITERIRKYMAAAGYRPSLKSKTYHALDSFVFEYVNAGGMKDNLKIEINYMLRAHVLPTTRRAVRLPWNNGELTRTGGAGALIIWSASAPSTSASSLSSCARYGHTRRKAASSPP